MFFDLRGSVISSEVACRAVVPQLRDEGWEGARCETCKVTSTGSFDCAQDDEIWMERRDDPRFPSAETIAKLANAFARTRFG
jgi:hypothetical protein